MHNRVNGGLAPRRAVGCWSLLPVLASLAPLVLGAQRPAAPSGVVFVDRNGNGARDAGERGQAGVMVSDQEQVVRTDSAGGFRFDRAAGHGLVFMTVPTGYRTVGPFWRAASQRPLSFALAATPPAPDFTFVHASDTHISQASLPRTVRLRQLVDSLRPAFVIITGDLVRDALRVSEAEARGYYDLLASELAKFTVPVWTAPGNHEIFGIERQLSKVSPDHPLFEKKMYRALRGPDYYSFDYGGVHFIALNTVDVNDQWYYGHVDSTQLAWLERDLAMVPAATSVVTFNHIPLFGTGEIWNGYSDKPPAPSLITVGGKTGFRHIVSNAGEVLARLRGHRYEMALGGHYHMRESIAYEIDGASTRFHQAAAVVAPTENQGIRHRSGVTLYRVRGGRLDDGSFVPIP